MFWLGSVLGLVIGAIIGAVLYKQFRSDAVRINQLESQLQKARHDHEAYQHQVHAHFHTTADLVHRMTDSYRDVYKHLAEGAQSLCPDTIADELSLSWENRNLLDKNKQEEDAPDTDNNAAAPTDTDADAMTAAAPRDYAEKTDPNRGTLSEDYGLTKVTPAGDSAQETDTATSGAPDAEGPYSAFTPRATSPEDAPAARITSTDDDSDAAGTDQDITPGDAADSDEADNLAASTDTDSLASTGTDIDDASRREEGASETAQDDPTHDAVSTYTPSSEDSDTTRRSS